MAKKFQAPKLPRYSYEFLRHINRFILKADLIKSDQRPVIALSGGVDSVALAYSVYLSVKHGLFISNEMPRLIHIDHGTREEIEFEREFLAGWSAELGLDFESIRLDFDLDESNFEHRARLGRYDSFKDSLATNEVLFTGHHLDDSFEWSMMQQFKSSNLKGTLGIPVKATQLARPFQCVSKSQIIRFAKESSLTWFEDLSNNDESFERNYIRRIIRDEIAPKYPQYLKHYANRHNELATKLGLSALSKTSPQEFFIKHDRKWGSIIKINGVLSEDDKSLLDIINSHSGLGRGKTQEQFKKLVRVINESNSVKGPLSFSGGLKIFYARPYLFIQKKNANIQYYKTAQIPEALPIITKATKKNSLKSPVVFMKEETQKLLDNSVPFHFSWRVEQGDILFWI
jgi:tRNA(Ile)-lysidine synthase